jgi:hypothetical protein
MPTKFDVGERVEDKKITSAAALPLSTARSSLETSLSRSCSTATTKQSLFRLMAFAKSQRGSHECRSYDLPHGSGCLSRNAGNGRRVRARAAKLDANRATLGGLAAELFFPTASRYRRSLIRNIIAVTPFRGVGFGAVWEAPP